jgi:hypothetical protein
MGNLSYLFFKKDHGCLKSFRGGALWCNGSTRYAADAETERRRRDVASKVETRL